MFNIDILNPTQLKWPAVGKFSDAAGIPNGQHQVLLAAMGIAPNTAAALVVVARGIGFCPWLRLRA